MRTDCLITGVILLHPATGKAYNGDLFQQGFTYIVNCNEASEHTLYPMPDGAKWVRPLGEYWMRRGVWIFPAAEAQFSNAALLYMEDI
jgi:hypothetical protein